MNILISSTGGSEYRGGIYDYEFDAIEKHAPILAMSEFECTEHLHWSRRFDISVLIVVVRGYDFNTQNIRLDLINRLSVLSQKVGRRVYLLTESSHHSDVTNAYRLHIVDSTHLIERTNLSRCYYLFKRHGSLRVNREEYYKDQGKGFGSVDWAELERFVISNS